MKKYKSFHNQKSIYIDQELEEKLLELKNFYEQKSISSTIRALIEAGYEKINNLIEEDK